MRKAISCVSAFLLLMLAACGGKPAAETKIPQAEIDRKNPVASSPASVAEGKQLYEATDCALCHGKDGNGRGVEAKDINMNTHDWHKADWLAKFTDGELSYLIMKGKGRMPKYEGRETPDQVWQIVNYIRSLPESASQ
ncbi:MAG: c-type cytochrome [Candidatus Acidiferrales bacterium]